MRIAPISISPARNYQHLNKRVAENVPNPQSEVVQPTPSFKGWGGVLGTLVGTAAGIGLAVLTGGASLACGAIPVLGGVGAIGGDMIEKKDNPDPNDYGI